MSEDRETETAWVEAAQGGDRSAYARLVDRYGGLVWSLLAARVRDRGVVEDLSQEVFLRAWRRLEQLEDPARFGAWLARIAVNATRDHHRRRAVRPTPATLDDGGPDPAAGNLPVDHEAVVDEEHGRVLEALARLDARSRAAVTLRFHEGLAMKEVARRIGSSPAATAMRLTRALRALRKDLDEA